MRCFQRGAQVGFECRKGMPRRRRSRHRLHLVWWAWKRREQDVFALNTLECQPGSLGHLLVEKVFTKHLLCASTWHTKLLTRNWYPQRATLGDLDFLWPWNFRGGVEKVTVCSPTGKVCTLPLYTLSICSVPCESQQ